MAGGATRWDPACQGAARWYATAARIASAVDVARRSCADGRRARRPCRWPARTRCRRRDGSATGGSHAPCRGARFGDELALQLRAARVGRDDDQRGVGAPSSSNGAGRRSPACRRARSTRRATPPSAPITSPTAFTTASAPITTSPSRAARRSEAAGVPCSPPRHLPTVAPRPAPTRPSVKTARDPRRRRARRGPRRAPGARHRTRRGRRSPRSARSGTGPPTRREAAALLGERVHHAVGGREPERRAAAEHDRVDVLDDGDRLEQRGLPGRGRAPADLARAAVSGGNDHHRDPGAVAGPVTDLDARGRR